MASIYVLCFLSVALTGVLALTKEELNTLRETIQPHMVACSKEFDVTEGDVEDAKKNKSIDGINSCFLSCMFKALGTMDSDGKLDADTAIEKSKMFLNDEDDRKKLEEILKICTKVNDEEVGEGDKGCERAKLLLSCIIENKGQFILPH